jgi:lipoprotein-anchoring transpeptidase ErfK/SrfK
MATRTIRIHLRAQRLELLEDGQPVETFAISTARNGAGERVDSECTPRGRHRIAQKIGAQLPAGAVLVGRVPTGEICDAETFRTNPDRDWILTRILWLDGLEPGRNLGDDVDTLARYIYIHGAPDAVPMGVPLSHGCVRMRNDDVCRLFDLVEEGTIVEILD